MSTIAETYYPPSVLPQANYALTDVRPSAHEIDCISKLRGILLPIHRSIQDAIIQLNSWRSDWTNHRDGLQEMYDDAERTLSHMEIDHKQEKKRLDATTEELQTLLGSLPNDNRSPGSISPQTDSNHVSYRKKRVEELEIDRQSHLRKANALQEKIKAQQEQLQTVQIDSIPAHLVMERFNSAFNAFCNIDQLLEAECRQLGSRVPTPAQSLKDDIWLKIFQIALQMQEEDNARILSSGLPRESMQCPLEMATSLASVCRRWSGILIQSDNNDIWNSWLVDMSQLDGSFPPLHPEQLDLAAQSIRIIFNFASSPDSRSLNDNILRILPQLQTTKVTHLGMVHSHGQDYSGLLRAAAREEHLRSLSVYGEASAGFSQFTIQGAVFQRLERMEVIDCGIKPSCLYTPGNQLRYLRLLHNDPQSPSKRMTSLEIYNLLSHLKRLEELEVDLGFEDLPQFAPVNYPSVPDMLSSLRSLRTRFTYFHNRLAFMHILGLQLPNLSSITMITIPEFSFKHQWSDLTELLTNISSIGTITRLVVEDIGISTREPRPPCPAGSILTYLNRLERIDLHREAATHFLEYLCTFTRDSEHASHLESLQELHIWDSTTSGDELLELLRWYRGKLLDRPRNSISLGGSEVPHFSSNSLRLRVVQTYRCNRVSTQTLNAITEMVPGHLLNSWELQT